MVHTGQQEPRQSPAEKTFLVFCLFARWGRGARPVWWHHDDGHQSSYPLSLQYWVGSGKFRDIFVAPHLILDNDGPHRHPNVNTWRAKHPQFHLHVTPASASWLNLVERWFRRSGASESRAASLRARRSCSKRSTSSFGSVTKITSRSCGLKQLKIFWRRPGVVKPLVRQ